jgi:membrane protein implicated in regulation of membrane protease activity
MLTAFVVIGVIGLVIAGLSIVAGDVFEGLLNFDFAPDGVMSSTTIAGTFAGAGFAGAFADSSFAADKPWLAIVVALAGGTVGWFIAWGFYRMLDSQSEPEGAGNLSEVIGTTGSVIRVPTESSGLGEVMLTFRGQPQKMNFLCDTPVSAGEEVSVVSVLTTTKVKVQPIGPVA